MLAASAAVVTTSAATIRSAIRPGSCPLFLVLFATVVSQRRPVYVHEVEVAPDACKLRERKIGLAARADEAAERERVERRHVHAALVDLPDVDLHASVVLRREDPVRPRALARHEQVNHLPAVVLETALKVRHVKI